MVLRDAAGARRRVTGFQSWDDDLLFALLSHSLLVAYGSRTISFFADLIGDDEEVAGLLEHLVVAAHDRWGRGRFGDYDPSGRTAVWRLAAYTANLVSLRLAMAQAPVPIARFCPPGAGVEDEWPAQVHIWTAVLPWSQWSEIVRSVRVERLPEPCLSWVSVSGFYNEMVEVLALQDGDAARLAVGRTLIWREPEAGDAPVPAAAATLANALQTWYLGQDARSLLRSPEALPGWLLSLAVTVAARHAADLGRDVLDGLLGACKEAEMPIAGERAGALVVWLPELLRDLDSGAVGEVGAVSIALAALIPDQDGRKVREWLHRTCGWRSPTPRRGGRCGSCRPISPGG